MKAYALKLHGAELRTNPLEVEGEVQVAKPQPQNTLDGNPKPTTAGATFQTLSSHKNQKCQKSKKKAYLELGGGVARVAGARCGPEDVLWRQVDAVRRNELQEDPPVPTLTAPTASDALSPSLLPMSVARAVFSPIKCSKQDKGHLQGGGEGDKFEQKAGGGNGSGKGRCMGFAINQKNVCAESNEQNNAQNAGLKHPSLKTSPRCTQV